MAGPDRNWSYPETGLLKEWPVGGPALLWETLDAGKGYSSPVLVNDRLYITGMNEEENREVFSAYTLDGRKIYGVEYGRHWKDSYPETRTTPSIEGDKAYVISGAGEIVCIHIEKGDILWKVDGETAFGKQTGTWGTSECPLVFDHRVIYTAGGEQTTMVALNAGTGETLWKSPSLEDKTAYVSPLLISYQGRKQIVGSTGMRVTGVDQETGEIEWTFDDWGQNAIANGREKIAVNTPLYADGKIFVCNGYDMNSFQLQLREDLKGVDLVWRNDDLDTHIGGFVLVDGTVYGSNWITNTNGNWVAVDWNTGKTRYEMGWKGGKSKGSIITADGMLYCYDERRGTVGLVKPNPEEFEVVSEFRITKGEGPHWAHPVIHNGILYIRHGNALMAYNIQS
ncbi:MAG: PQQ-binding-like beta-propeller repeat protein [Bacteroides sp.]|nr:PQQ-binding-like beta-propeller repeat protein [Bacteroides sp.]